MYPLLVTFHACMFVARTNCINLIAMIQRVSKLYKEEKSFHVKQTLHLFITLDCNMLLESESFYIPVPSSDVEQTESGEFSLLIK